MFSIRVSLICALVGLGGCSRVVDQDHLREDRGILYADQEQIPFTGIAAARHHNGSKRMDGQYLNGKRHGLWSWYHDDSSRAMRGGYRAGVPRGTWRAWYRNGTLRWQWEITDSSVVAQSFMRDGSAEMAARSEVLSAESSQVSYRTFDRSGHVISDRTEHVAGDRRDDLMRFVAEEIDRIDRRAAVTVVHRQ